MMFIMLRYSTYESIYNENSETQGQTHTYTWSDRIKSFISQQLMKKIICLVLLFIVCCTGMVSVFANSTSAVQEEKHLIIQPGDTLWEIALNEKPSNMDTRVYIKEIRNLNGLSNGVIMAGEILSLPQY